MDALVREDVFHFKQFDICQDQCLMKVCTDGILLGSWVGLDGVESALDIGTGSGIIALMMAQRSDTIRQVTGIEIDQNSYLQACTNAAQSNWNNRLQMVHAPIQQYANTTEYTYDLIVSNPPFFTGGTLSESQPKNNVRHTVKLPHNDLLRSVKKLMSHKGHFGVILPVMEGYRFIELAEQYRLYLTRRTYVFTRPGKPLERFLMEFSHQETDEVFESDLFIHHEDSDGYTREYKELTGPFYLNL